MYYFSTRDEMIRAIAKPGFRIAELGVFLGQFAQVLLTTLPKELVLIDPWAGKVQSGDQDGQNVVVADLDAAYPLLCKHFAQFPNAVVKRGLSTEVLSQYPDDSFDLVYIDADHSYEGCKADLEMAYKKVKPGGWITGHDMGCNLLKCKTAWCFGVEQAVQEFCARRGQKITALGLDGCISWAIQLKK